MYYVIASFPYKDEATAKLAAEEIVKADQEARVTIVQDPLCALILAEGGQQTMTI